MPQAVAHASARRRSQLLATASVRCCGALRQCAAEGRISGIFRYPG